MDIDNLKELLNFIIPYLPHAIKGAKIVGTKALESLGEKSGEEAFEAAKKLIERLKNLSANDAEIRTEIEKVVEVGPNDESLNKLAYALNTLSAQNKSLANEIVSSAQILLPIQREINFQIQSGKYIINAPDSKNMHVGDMGRDDD